MAITTPKPAARRFCQACGRPEADIENGVDSYTPKELGIVGKPHIIPIGKPADEPEIPFDIKDVRLCCFCAAKAVAWWDEHMIPFMQLVVNLDYSIRSPSGRARITLIKLFIGEETARDGWRKAGGKWAKRWVLVGDEYKPGPAPE